MRRRNVAAAVLLAAVGTLGTGGSAAHAQAQTLRAGVGRADITPPTGFPMMGWVRSDARTTGQHTRLYARVIVLQEGGRKLALVAEDLNGIPGGMLQEAVKLVADRGFTDENVLDSASHTHAGPGGFYNFPTYNFLAPTQGTLTDFNAPSPPDRQLYGFMVRQLAMAIRRADDDLAPARLGWGATKLVGLTQNRSLEAHLADLGVFKNFGEGKLSDDPLGYEDTIDPEVNVLRVDKIGPRGRSVPVGIWSTFADHGTVNKYTFHYYNADHHGSATRVAEADIRAQGRTPPSQDVVVAYGNTDEGDQSAGLIRSGPEQADEVGRVEAAAFMAAWREAGKSMIATPPMDSRWTRVCFCGQAVGDGHVASMAVLGLPQITGSEEGRGPLYDITHQAYEGQRNPVDLGGDQGHKLLETADTGGDIPRGAPLMAVRIGDRMIVSVPGEMTSEMGKRLRDAVLKASSGAGITRVVISGLANEYISYFTTPEEYDRQHYEGGSTLYGPLSSVFIQNNLVDLASRLVAGQPAPSPYPFDPTHGTAPDMTPYDQGPSEGTADSQPGNVRRLQQVHFSWTGGPRGFDRPLDRPFVSMEAHVAGDQWSHVADDLGLDVLWLVDGNRYTATWEVPINAPRGEYRFHITANRYEVVSSSFRVAPITDLALKATSGRGGRPGIFVSYPGNHGLTADVPPKDPGALQGDGEQLAWHPTNPSGGIVSFRVGGKRVRVRRKAGAGWSVRAGRRKPVEVPAFGVHDPYGNTNAQGLKLR
jgi:neutral ceramidase